MAEIETRPSVATFGAKVGAWVMLCLFIPTFIAVFDGIATLAAQVLGWLKTGIWKPQTAWDGLHKWLLSDRPSVDWVIPNNILDWVLDGPRWVWLPTFGLIYFGLVLWAVIGIMTWVENRWGKIPVAD